MEATFKAGDKVKHEARGEVEVSYGPYTNSFGSERYLIRLENGREVGVSPDVLAVIPEPPTFAVGDKVTYRGEEHTLAGGPFVSALRGHNFWVLERDGKHSAPDERGLTKVTEPAPLKVGDRVRVVEDDSLFRAGEFIGKTGVVTYLSGSGRLPYRVRFDASQGTPHSVWNCASVERVDDENTVTHDGVTYDLSARYRDSDGDYWTFKDVAGTVRGSCSRVNVDRSAHISEYCDTLSEAVSGYGPLRKV